MKRIVATGAMAALMLSFSACGGGADVGMPADAPPPKQIDMSDKFKNMKEMVKKAAMMKTKRGSPGVGGKP